MPRGQYVRKPKEGAQPSDAPEGETTMADSVVDKGAVDTSKDAEKTQQVGQGAVTSMEETDETKNVEFTSPTRRVEPMGNFTNNFVVIDGKVVPLSPAMFQAGPVELPADINETVPGGRYKTADGRWVNANGEELKG